MLAGTVRKSGGSGIVVELSEAVELLFDGKLPRRHYTERHRGPCGCEVYTRTFVEKASREIKRRTEGQAFRVDTPQGPIFVAEPLWYFAGCSGPVNSPPSGARSKAVPTWDGDPMTAVAR
jgi:hypothetical protein